MIIEHTNFIDYTTIVESFRERYGDIEEVEKKSGAAFRFNTDRGDQVYVSFTKLAMDVYAMEDILMQFGDPVDPRLNKTMNVYNIAFSSNTTGFEITQNSSTREAMKILGTVAYLFKRVEEEKKVHMFIFEAHSPRQEQLYTRMLDHFQQRDNYIWYSDGEEFFVRTTRNV